MKVAYVHVSILNQNLERRIEVYENFGIEKIFTEKLSSKNISERFLFQEAMQLIRG